MSEPATELPRPTLEEALAQLRNLPTFQQVIEFIGEEREEMIGKFASVINDGEAMKTAGAVAAIDRVLMAFRG